MSRVLQSLALGAALALCGPLLPAAIGSNSVTAQAADFTGQVRRIRIKARNNGAGYRLKIVHPAGEIDSAQAVVRDPITGESLASTDLGPAGRATAVAIAKVDPSTLGDRLTIGVTDRDQGFSTVGVALSEGRGEAANADGWKVRAVVNANGRVRVTVGNDDRDWDGTTLTSVTLLQPDQEVALPIERIDQRRVARLDVNLILFETVEVTVAAFDALGNPVEEVTGSVEVEGDAGRPPLETVIVDEAMGQVQLTTWLAGDDDLAVRYALRDASTGEIVFTGTDGIPLVTQRQWAGAPVGFDASPAGFTYALSVGRVDAEGNPLADPDPIDVDLVALEPGEEIRGSYQLFADGAGIAGFNTDGVGYFPVVWYEGDDPVAHVTLTFEEPTDGPPPAEPQLVLDPIGTYAQYVLVADVALPDSWELEVEARTPEGRVLESGTFAGSGTGVAYRGIPLIERKIVSYSGRASGTRYGVK